MKRLDASPVGSQISRLRASFLLLFATLVCLGRPGIPSLHAQAPARSEVKAEMRGPEGSGLLPAPDPRKAQRAANAARAAESQLDYATAFRKYSEALSLAPDSREFLDGRERARFRALQERMDRAEREALAARPWAAEAELYAALALDPNFSVARERLAQLQRTLPRKVKEPRSTDPATIVLRPAPVKQSFDYRGNTVGAYEEIARQFGMTASFDQDIASKSLRFRVADVDFFTAVFILGEQTKTFIRPLTERMFFVTNDTPDKRKQYEPRVTRSFPLDASTTPERMNEIRNAVREIADVANPQLDTRTRQITVSGPALTVALAGEVIAEIEQAPSEMMLEVNIFEVDRVTAQRLGIRTPSEARVFTLTPEDIAEAQSSSEGLLRVLSRVFGSTGSTTLTQQQALGQLGTGTINPTSLIPPLIAFGGGKSVFLATLPGASAEFSESLSFLRRARRVLLRGLDGQPATFFVGDRFPISLGVLSPGDVSTPVVIGVQVSDYDTGLEPRAVATGDFDGTGGPDFAVANFEEDTVFVFLNDGTGKFGTISTIIADDGPRALLARDFDADGTLDLAIAHANSNTIAVLLGNGDGTFTATSNFATQTQPVALAAGEFTGDGRLDLVVANEGSDNLTLFPGNGDGTFGAAIVIPTGVAPRAVIVGDWNGDSLSDLAVANSGSNTISVFLGNGAGGFTLSDTLSTGDTPGALASGDFNLDGFSDLVVTNEGSNSVSVFLGLGTGAFSASTDFPAGANPTGIVAADFTADGRTDLVIANSGASLLSVLAGLGNGDFASVASLSLNASAFAIASADVDADGRPDVVTANPDANTATVVINNASSASSLASALQQAYPAAVYEDIGVKVRATPRLHPGREVTLKLEIELKSLALSNFNGIPVISNRSVEQMTRLKEGQTTVLAGIVTEETTGSSTGWTGQSVPPIAGHLTSRRDKDVRQVELLISVTPRRLRLAPRKDRLIYAGKPGEGGPPTQQEPPQ